MAAGGNFKRKTLSLCFTRHPGGAGKEDDSNYFADKTGQGAFTVPWANPQ